MKKEFEELGYKNRIECIKDQFNQYLKEGNYIEHYIANAVFALFNNDKLFVDYRKISHKNLLMMHGFGRLFGMSADFGDLEEKVN